LTGLTDSDRPITLIQNFWRFRGHQTGVWCGNKLFSSFMRRYVENGTRYDQSYC